MNLLFLAPILTIPLAGVLGAWFAVRRERARGTFRPVDERDVIARLAEQID